MRRDDDDYGLDVLVVNGRNGVRRGPLRRRETAARFGGLRIWVSNDDHSRVGDRGEVAQVCPAHASRSQDRNANAGGTRAENLPIASILTESIRGN
jgi:hypothetical protein